MPVVCPQGIFSTVLVQSTRVLYFYANLLSDHRHWGLHIRCLHLYNHCILPSTLQIQTAQSLPVIFLHEVLLSVLLVLFVFCVSSHPIKDYIQKSHQPSHTHFPLCVSMVSTSISFPATSSGNINILGTRYIFSAQQILLFSINENILHITELNKSFCILSRILMNHYFITNILSIFNRWDDKLIILMSPLILKSCQ